jgi:hypothetical protein
MRGHLFSSVCTPPCLRNSEQCRIASGGERDFQTPAENADDARSDAPYDASTRRTKVQLRWRAGVT